MNARKSLTRSNDGIIGGVIRGLAEYWDVNPNLLRLIYIVVSAASAAFPGILFYILLWIILPKERTV